MDTGRIITITGTQYETSDGILQALIGGEPVGRSVDDLYELAGEWETNANVPRPALASSDRGKRSGKSFRGFPPTPVVFALHVEVPEGELHPVDTVHVILRVGAPIEGVDHPIGRVFGLPIDVNVEGGQIVVIRS